ncbi:MAG: hypothetical protein JWL75_791 [Parcubacteria group bacterium]|nr:hypothetical protein [Parcubacteria group bacterium]
MEEFELEPGEEIVLEVRQHMMVFVLRALPLLLLAFLPTILLALLSLFAGASPQTASLFASLNLPSNIARFFKGLWLLAIWTAFFSMLTRHYLTVWIITNVRIVDIKQYGFFNRTVSSFLLMRVQDITTDVSGMLATIFRFGRLSVETAGKDEEFQMSGIVHPEHLRDVIMGQVAALHGQVAQDSVD